jgi:predicted DNA-binding transcriptional regulator AlpA
MSTNNSITLTAGEAAKVLGLASSTLAKLRLSGNGPVYCKLGRRVVYRREDLEVWLESRVTRDTSDADARLPKSLTGLVRLRRTYSVGDIARLLGIHRDTVRGWVEQGLVVIDNPSPSGNATLTIMTGTGGS